MVIIIERLHNDNFKSNLDKQITNWIKLFLILCKPFELKTNSNKKVFRKLILFNFSCIFNNPDYSATK